MVIDTSAIVAILTNEASAPALETELASAESRLVSAATVLEASIVLEARLGDAGGAELDRLLQAISATIVPVDSDQVEEARAAWRRFGRGRHPAALNYGDCFSYALSRVTGEPLLFTGGDFALTDVARPRLEA